jgi:branched-chain amino acid transport system permease protein
MTFLNQLIAGITASGPVMLIACSLSVVLASSRMLNVAVSGIYSLVGILAITYIVRFGVVLTIAFCVLAPIALCMVMDALILRPQRRVASDPEMSTFAATLGTALVLGGVAAIISHSATLSLPTNMLEINGAWSSGGLIVSKADVIVWLVAAVVTVTLYLLLYRTRLGLTFRSVAADPFLSRTVGIRPPRVITRSWIISGLLLGVATLLALITQRSVDFEAGNNLLLVPFAAVVAGGMGNLAGAAVASLFFGIAEALTTLITPSDGLQSAIVFGLVMCILIFRPEGFLPSARSTRAY